MPRKASVFLCATFLSLLTGIPVHANMKQIKFYKEIYPDAKPKCIQCHMVALPKKEDGQHELNAYGQAVKKAASEPTAETYKQVGKAEDFKADIK